MSRRRTYFLSSSSCFSRGRRPSTPLRDPISYCHKPLLQPYPNISSSTEVRRLHRPYLSQRAYRYDLNRYASSNSHAPRSASIPEGLVEKQSLVTSMYDEVVNNSTDSGKLPEEKDVLKVLQTYQAIAETLVHTTSDHPDDATPNTPSATSAILKSMHKGQHGSLTPTSLLNGISKLATEIVQRPTVFITAPILKTYIELEAKLGRPQNFPTIFDLYRHKPSPRPSSQPPHYTLVASNPNAPSVAIHPVVATTALQAAITAHDLPLCLSIIDRTFCTTAYARYKILRSALVPLAGAVAAPVAAYTLASQFALTQTTMDPAHATTVAMAGIMTYLMTVGSMGYIAVTTANDQMVRVTWTSGLPLWERWVREEERAAVDAVAQAWGFKSRTRWGDEEGRDWEDLREWAGLRGMVLDKVEFMQGME